MCRTAYLIYKMLCDTDSCVTILENCCSFLLKTNCLPPLQILFWLYEKLSNALWSASLIFLKMCVTGGDSSCRG